jgi:hypothetical protein
MRNRDPAVTNCLMLAGNYEKENAGMIFEYKDSSCFNLFSEKEEPLSGDFYSG